HVKLLPLIGGLRQGLGFLGIVDDFQAIAQPLNHGACNKNDPSSA
ncbi:MAG: hypothetical protein ACJASZ_000883, partial [Yoonia sp.]